MEINHVLPPAGDNLLTMTAKIVAAYAGNHAVASAELPDLIRSVHSALADLSGYQPKLGGHTPAVAIKKSIMPGYLICLEDGKKLKMLKRYLRSNYRMTPTEYRLKWGLPADYPMVAPNYSRQRSAFAKKIGLGRQNRIDS
jgi:predicted transcriptional regulator